jgi:hypothetical protein
MSSLSFAGTAMVVTWNALPLTGEYRRVTINQTVNDADGTSGPDTEIRHMPTQTNANIALEMTAMSGTAGTATWSALTPRTAGTLIVQPEGTALNLRKYTSVCYVQAFNDNIPYNEAVIWAVTFYPSAAITRGYNA